MPRGENIYKRKDGRWEGRFPKSRKKDGSIYYGYVYARSYRSVKEQLLEKKSQYRSTMHQPSVTFKGSFGDWADQWLNIWMIDQIKESTYASYQHKLTQHIIPVIGKVSLELLNVSHINKLVGDLKKKLAPSSIQVVFRVLKSCLKMAKDKGYIFLNPTDNVSLPRTIKKQVPALTRREHQMLLKESKQTIQGLPVLIALETGMRIGEISALQWSDVDFEQKTIKVNRTKQRIATSKVTLIGKTKLVETTPKTIKALRIIPLTEELFNALLKAKTQSKSLYVVETKGTGTEPRTISYRLEKMKTKLGLSGFGFHSLRHTFATRCVEIGINIATISALLGHASIKMTLDTYTSSFLESQQAAIAQFSRQNF